MTIFTLACVLTGMAIGLRCRVLATIPLTLLVMIATGALGGVAGTPIGSILLSIVLNAAALQLGYLCGAFAQSSLREPAVIEPTAQPVRYSAPTSLSRNI